MTERNEFGPERDEAMGALLHEHLSTTDDASFAESVMARIRREPRESSWEVLAGPARQTDGCGRYRRSSRVAVDQ